MAGAPASLMPVLLPPTLRHPPSATTTQFPPPMVKLINGLEDAGLVERRRRPNDPAPGRWRSRRRASAPWVRARRLASQVEVKGNATWHGALSQDRALSVPRLSSAPSA